MSDPATAPTSLKLPNGYHAAIDGLRAVCITAVLILHVNLLVPLPFMLLRGGFLGVEMFFVISGFLITSLLVAEHEDTGGISIGRFYVRRALRLLPAVFTCLLFTCALALMVGSFSALGLTPLRIVSIFGYFTNWVRAFETWHVWFLAHFWSLAIEEQFYLLWPLALVALLKFTSRRQVILLVTTAILCSCAFKVILFSSGFPNIRLYHGTDTRADALLTGCLLALALRWEMIPQISDKMLMLLARLSVIVLGTMALIARESAPFMYYGGFNLAAASSAILILVAVFWSPRLLMHPILIWIGKRSYGLYVWHWPIYQLTWSLPKWLIVPTALTGTFLAAALSYRFIESPFLRVKSRFSGKAHHDVHGFIPHLNISHKKARKAQTSQSLNSEL